MELRAGSNFHSEPDERLVCAPTNPGRILQDLKIKNTLLRVPCNGWKIESLYGEDFNMRYPHVSILFNFELKLSIMQNERQDLC